MVLAFVIFIVVNMVKLASFVINLKNSALVVTSILGVVALIIICAYLTMTFLTNVSSNLFVP